MPKLSRTTTEDAEHALLQQRIARAKTLLIRLILWRAELHYPCETCGCVLWCRVIGGWRCIHCWPPLDLPEELRAQVAADL